MLALVILIVVEVATVVLALRSSTPGTPSRVPPVAMAETIPELPDGLDLPRALGDFLLPRVLQEEWIHRRVESIIFLGTSRVRRKVSLDLELPKVSPGLTEGSDRCCIVPLTYLLKGSTENDAVLRDFDVRDEQGRRLPTLGRHAHRLATLALLGRAIERLAGPSSRLTGHEMEELWAVVASPLEPAERRCAYLEERIRENDQDLPTMVSAWRRDRENAELLEFLLRWLSGHSLLLADLGGRRRGGRRIIELAYDAWAPPPSASTGRRKKDRQRPKTDPDDAPPPLWKVRLGWAGVRVDFEPWAALPCESQHLEIEAPAQMIVTHARTRVVTRKRRLDDGDGREGGDPASTLVGLVIEDANLARHQTLAHIRQPGIPAAAFVQASVVFDSAGGGSGWLAVWAAIALAIGLEAGALWTASVHQPDAAATVLVFVPGLLLTASFVAGQHAVVGPWRSAFRSLLWLVGVVSVIAATSLVTLPGDPTSAQIEFVSVLWHILFVVTLVISLALYWAVRTRRSRR